MSTTKIKLSYPTGQLLTRIGRLSIDSLQMHELEDRITRDQEERTRERKKAQIRRSRKKT